MFVKKQKLIFHNHQYEIIKKILKILVCRISYQCLMIVTYKIIVPLLKKMSLNLVRLKNVKEIVILFINLFVQIRILLIKILEIHIPTHV